MVVEKRNLLGPAVFLNHACELHCHCTFDQPDQEGDHQPILRMLESDLVEYVEDHDEDDDITNQIFVYYGTDDFDGVTCPICKMEENDE